MEIYPDIDALPDEPIEPVCTMGNYDGVHRGHQAILARIQEEARRLDAPSMVITFDPHPRTVLRPHLPHQAIMSLRERLRTFWDLGIDHCLVIPFDQDFAEMTAREFVEEVLWEDLRIHALHIGPHTTFGHERSGDEKFLASEGRRLGFDVGVVDPVYIDGERVSSTRVRKAILAGDMQLAAKLLGRQHLVVGEVVEGDRRGRELGFPTANLKTDGAMLPPAGVYAAWAWREGAERRRAVVNIGYRPTFHDDSGLTVEAHLLDFEGDLYGETLFLGLVKRIRGEAKFEAIPQLKRQIKRDAGDARRILGGGG
ncbi:MAG: bifunctional riboflavin kinase/FAD synthetase [Myxococcota bacterium]